MEVVAEHSMVTAGVPRLLQHTPLPHDALRYLAYDPVDRDERRVPHWPMPPAPAYRGQLNDAFQAAQAAMRAGVRPADCHWYHEVPLRDGSRMCGAWDLIGGEDHYTGAVALRGKRVLEFGPASGYITYFLERVGAEVVAFEAGFDACIDLLAFGRSDVEAMRTNAMRFVAEVNNSWWWVKQHHNLDARIAYGDIYRMPDDLGMFDVTMFGAILLHLRDPFTALQQAAQVTTECLIVTDLVPLMGDPWRDAFSRFHPAPGDPTSWWLHTPAVVQRMLETLGFVEIERTRHTQYVRPSHALDQPLEPVEFFTLVARRP
ncbi:MAG: methyltransferase type 11 [Actinomycetia bacterium]|nr:methyltransferase type 11 [Actinomycetes bacterium]